ncbi:MAG: hypothetical protein H7831_04765 [Magnetococcus sp. WYHC-3]
MWQHDKPNQSASVQQSGSQSSGNSTTANTAKSSDSVRFSSFASRMGGMAVAQSFERGEKIATKGSSK